MLDALLIKGFINVQNGTPLLLYQWILTAVTEVTGLLSLQLHLVADDLHVLLLDALQEVHLVDQKVELVEGVSEFLEDRVDSR